jgi:hypothetical protein
LHNLKFVRSMRDGIFFSTILSEAELNIVTNYHHPNSTVAL